MNAPDQLDTPAAHAAGHSVPAPPRRRGGAAWLLAFTALVVASFASLDLHFSGLFAPGAAATMAEFIAGFAPPQSDAAFLARLAKATVDTFAMSALGTVLAAIVGLALALPASAQGAGWPRLLRGVARGVLNALRAVPELVWAALLLISTGLGPFAGTLALALHTTGVLGRLLAESIENTAPEPAFALSLRGTGRLQVFCFATLPQITPQLLSYALYRWEINIRAAAVLGVVGAGGLGQMLVFHLSLFQLHASASVLLAMGALVLAVDASSAWARARLMR